MFCTNHPDTRAISVCQKFGIGQCEECIACKDPNLYCKFRDHCIAWELLKENNIVQGERR
ncbi:MAG: hypothetical protein C4549_05425 [Deltaproteobacteria bacterium]|nr:MAG: hypothetical protein C4549_05425 [Deltaproteobacteria bacterium]